MDKNTDRAKLHMELNAQMWALTHSINELRAKRIQQRERGNIDYSISSQIANASATIEGLKIRARRVRMDLRYHGVQTVYFPLHDD